MGISAELTSLILLNESYFKDNIPWEADNEKVYWALSHGQKPIAVAYDNEESSLPGCFNPLHEPSKKRKAEYSSNFLKL